MRADKSSIKPNYRQKVQVVLALGTIKVRRLRAGLGMALLNFDKAKLAQAENRPVDGLHATACLLSELLFRAAHAVGQRRFRRNVT